MDSLNDHLYCTGSGWIEILTLLFESYSLSQFYSSHKIQSQEQCKWSACTLPLRPLAASCGTPLSGCWRWVSHSAGDWQGDDLPSAGTDRSRSALFSALPGEQERVRSNWSRSYDTRGLRTLRKGNFISTLFRKYTSIGRIKPAYPDSSTLYGGSLHTVRKKEKAIMII